MPRYWYNEAEGILEEDPYPNLREALAPEYANLPPEGVDALVRRTLGVPAEDVEGWFDKALGSVGSAFSGAYKAASPYIAPVLSGAASGAATGAALGPWGALGGALLGGVTGGLSASQRPGGQPAPSGGGSPLSGLAGMATGALSGAKGGSPLGGLAGMAAGALGGGGGAGGAAAGGLAALLPAILGGVGGGGGAAGILASLFSRPEIIQAFTSMAMGKAGRSTSNVGGTPVPVGAFANLLGALTHQAAAEYAAVAPESTAVPVYLLNSEGEYAVDPAVPEQRAARLLEMLMETALTEANPAPRRAARYSPEDLQEMREEEYYDMLDTLAMEAGVEWED